MHTKLWLENLKGRNRSEDLEIDGKLTLELISGEQGGKVRTGITCLGTGTINGLL
jgi:hypothetical protein